MPCWHASLMSPRKTSRCVVPICRRWQTAVRSRLHLHQGHWRAALDDTQDVLNSEGMPLAELWPHPVNVLVALRRGEKVHLPY